MWVLPFLYYHHAYPITTFYQEWGAGFLGLCAMPLLLTARYWQAPEVPRIVMLPIGLMLLLMVQFLVGRIDHFDHLMLLSLYFLFAALLIMLGQRLRVDLGLPTLVAVLAMFLLVGAELNTLAGILQHYRWNTFLNPVITVKTSICGVWQHRAAKSLCQLHLFGVDLLGAVVCAVFNACVASGPAGDADAVRHGVIRFTQFLAIPVVRHRIGLYLAASRQDVASVAELQSGTVAGVWFDAFCCADSMAGGCYR